MKKLTILICVLALLLALAGLAWASPPNPGEFTITGLTTSIEPFPPEPLRSGLIKFSLTAVGNVSGDYFDGAVFTYDEWGIVRPDLSGNNRGLMTVISSTTTITSSAVVAFRGRSQITDPSPPNPEGWVEGTFTVLDGTGNYARLHGQGTYTGTMASPFTVTFTGQFHTDP